jgi:uncharacterized FlgJ-related protein
MAEHAEDAYLEIRKQLLELREHHRALDSALAKRYARMAEAFQTKLPDLESVDRLTLTPESLLTWLAKYIDGRG